MTTSSESTPITLELERRLQAFDGLFALIRTLGGAYDVQRVAKLSLLTVTGQLLVRRGALYTLGEGGTSLELCATLGVRPGRIQEYQLPIPDPAYYAEASVRTLDSSSGFPRALLSHFDRAAFLTNDDRFVGLLLLGGSIGGRPFSTQDTHLLEIMGMVIGTTLQKALLYEAMAQAKRQLEEAERWRQSVIDHVSHEFNTPLMVLKEAADLLPDASDDVRHELLEMQREAVERLQQLVKAVLLFSQVDAQDAHGGSMALDDFQAAVLRPILHRFHTESACTYQAHQAEPGIMVQVDASAVQVALRALLDNAVSFGRPDFPWIVVNSYVTARGWWERQAHVRRIAFYRDYVRSREDPNLDGIWFGEDAEVPGGPGVLEPVVVVEVIDSGIGIPAHQIAQVFEPFTQGTNSPTYGVKGAGMGLTGCRKLIHNLGGEVVLQSVEGEGTVVAILLRALRP
jgi:signal transduction histidine kinase